MSDGSAAAADRVAKYKEERRRQLAAQYGPRLSQEALSSPVVKRYITRPRNVGGCEDKPVENGSSSEGVQVRSTRASRLRAAATGASPETSPRSDLTKRADSLQSQHTNGSLDHKQMGLLGAEAVPMRRQERDKSAKRKSNLNRALNSEEVSTTNEDDASAGYRRRRRPQPLEETQSVSKNGFTADKLSSPTPAVADTHTSSPNNNATPRRSDLSIHMENARKSVSSASLSTASPRRSITSSLSKAKLSESRKGSASGSEASQHSANASDDSINKTNGRSANKENVETASRLRNRLSSSSLDKTHLPAKTDAKSRILSSADRRPSRTSITKKVDELSALTHETLARVECLSGKSRFAAYGRSKSSSRSPERARNLVAKRCESDTDVGPALKPALPLKKAPQERDVTPPLILAPPQVLAQPPKVTPPPPPPPLPISILKRKPSQDESGALAPPAPQPVKFSPSVVEPSTSRQKQGILKKRCSLDEAQVLSSRSRSPEASAPHSESPEYKPILKNLRRSSFEDVARRRTQSPEIPGILKRKRQSGEASLGSPEPQSILKRKSGTSSSSGSSGGSQHHVSITTAVILAAAGGAEMVLESSEPVKPILKKKSFSEERPSLDCAPAEAPRPILKKKSSTDTDEQEDRPKKPILKTSKRCSLEETSSGFDAWESDVQKKRSWHRSSDALSDCDVKPILKPSSSRENSPRPRLSFSRNEKILEAIISPDNDAEVTLRHPRISRRSTVGSNIDIGSILDEISSNNERRASGNRPNSVLDMVLSFENSSAAATGAIPKKTGPRSSDRFYTQPVTSKELQATSNLEDIKISTMSSSEVENEASAEMKTPPPKEACTTMETSKNEDLLADEGQSQKLFRSGSVSEKLSIFKQMEIKALADESKELPPKKAISTGVQRYRERRSAAKASSRVSTQPITSEEVEEAQRANQNAGSKEESGLDPSKLSLADRVRLFNQKLVEKPPPPPPPQAPPQTGRRSMKTLPVTTEEVEIARKISPLVASMMKPLDDALLAGLVAKEAQSKISTSAEKMPTGEKQVDEQHQDKKAESSSEDEGEECASADDESAGSSADDDDDDVETGGNAKCAAEKSGSQSALIRELQARNRMRRRVEEEVSDGESSGGQEVSGIIANEAVSRRRQASLKKTIDKDCPEALSKCRSQPALQDPCRSPSPCAGSSPDRDSGGVIRSSTEADMPRGGLIADRLNELQHSGDNDWRKRIPRLNTASDEINQFTAIASKNLYNDSLSEKKSPAGTGFILSARKGELENAKQEWRKKVEHTDAIKFSVAGRMKMEEKEVPLLPITVGERKKFTRSEINRSVEISAIREVSSLPTSPEKDNTKNNFRRTQSNSDEKSDTIISKSTEPLKKVVQVHRPDDETFTKFYESVNADWKEVELIISKDDLDSVTREASKLLVARRNIKVQRKNVSSKNPVKALAARKDLREEYTEIIHGYGEQESKRINVEKLSKQSNLAVEALAGLASKEDFTAVNLKSASLTASSALVPYKDLMLLQIKGRRHVQTRLVEPVAGSLNSGDNFILVTPSQVYNYVGKYSNVIEQSRGSEVAAIIQQKKDLGCRCSAVVTVNESRPACSKSQLEAFWKHLGASVGVEIAGAGRHDEDEIFESAVIKTNMVYEVMDGELVPLDEHFGLLPKFGLLESSKILVFDFGSEMYVWNGKTVPMERKKVANRLAKELWDKGYDYSEDGVCPVTAASVLGNRASAPDAKQAPSRPSWALFGKVTQHMETILFREKFLDWPDSSRLIKVKKDREKAAAAGSFEIKPIPSNLLREPNNTWPDLELEGSHLGRGNQYYDEETGRMSKISLLELTGWRIQEYDADKLSEAEMGQFFSGDSYIYRWKYRVTVTGKQLDGKPSKHNTLGRDRCVYFCWQGKNASLNEKGAAALLTVELDHEKVPQQRVVQGSEPPAFLRLFAGRMVVHEGKQADGAARPSRLYICRGELESELHLVEVPCSARQLRSRASFVLVAAGRKATVWHGSKCPKHARSLATRAALSLSLELAEEEEEGHETPEFLGLLGGSGRSSSAATGCLERMFHFTSTSGAFHAGEVLCPFRAPDRVTPYPFLQSDLYAANQPALFLLDAGTELWLWQGWWPETESDSDGDSGSSHSDQTGSGSVRWQTERKAAMQTALDFLEDTGRKGAPAMLVWAGLEPPAFVELFPTWTAMLDVAELNIKEGKKPNETVNIEQELARLTRSTYPLSELRERPLPEGVDPARLEVYLSPEDFEECLGMAKEEFHKLPPWKQTDIKKSCGLF